MVNGWCAVKMVNVPDDDPLEAMEHVYLTVAEIKRIYGVNSTSYVYKLASLYGWRKRAAPEIVRRQTGANHVSVYCFADVDRKLGKLSAWAQRDQQKLG